jgi:hypothetical protein
LALANPYFEKGGFLDQGQESFYEREKKTETANLLTLCPKRGLIRMLTVVKIKRQD